MYLSIFHGAKEYETRLERMEKVIYKELCKNFEFDNKNPKFVLEN